MSDEESAAQPQAPAQSRGAGLRWIAIGSALGLLVSGGLAISMWSADPETDSAPGVVSAHGTSFLTNFEPLHLLDQTGRPFDPQALHGKVVLFNFIFTSCPKICPLQTRALLEVQRKLAEPDRARVHFVSVSIDPVNDTPEVLRAFAARYEVDLSRWTFVTGEKADINRLADRLRVFAENQERVPDNHGTALWLMDAQGRLMQRYAGNPPEVDRLASELQALLHMPSAEPAQAP